MNRADEKKFVKECRTWLGTKWMHGVCLKGYRVDCAHYIVALAKYMGWLDLKYKIRPYPRDWALHSSKSLMMKELERFCRPVPPGKVKTGDILVYVFGQCESHLAWYLGGGKAIHSHIKYGVVEFNVNDPAMRSRFTIAMRWKGKR